LRRTAALTGLAALALGAAVSCGDDDPEGRPVVEVFGPVVGESGTRLAEVLREASADSPVELRYVGVTSFDEQLADRLDRGDRPGVALLPQPGRLFDLVERGLVAPLDDALVASLRSSTAPALLDLVSVDGQPAASWLTVDVKGLLWYRPDVVAAQVGTVPATLDELVAFSATEAGDGDAVAPFCVALEAGSSTGWVGTDLVESFVLQRLGPAAYDRWTTGDVRFDSPEIAGVFGELDDLLRVPGAVAGGTSRALGTPWGDAAGQLLGDPARCVFVHQADFLRREFSATTAVDAAGDVDFAPMPGTGRDRSLLLGGLLAAPLDGTPAVQEAMVLLAGPEVATALFETGLYLSPHRAARSAVTDPVAARLVDLVTGAQVVRFDGSDLMEPAIGTGTFWTGMRAFFAGESVDAVLAVIESGRA
jgi:alpha-glucoside transport system substrate-binding protein